MPNDEQDKAGAVAPPPLIYLGILVFGLLLNGRFPTAFLPRTIARRLGWPLLSAGVLLLGWFERTIRHAGTTDSPYEPVSHLELAPIGEYRMCQRAVRRLCNPCERCLVRKVARLLAQPLSHRSAWKVNPPKANFRFTAF